MTLPPAARPAPAAGGRALPHPGALPRPGALSAPGGDRPVTGTPPAPGDRPLAGGLPLARDLARHGDRTAVVTSERELSYRELAGRVAETAARLGPGRRLVLLRGANTVAALTAHLAALAAGHVVLLVPGDHPESVAALTAAYDPDVVVHPEAGGEPRIEERRPGSAHALHPDLALLLSTSGSTGSPKLVRLSYENLQANAESIAAYLGIRDTDRAATTLPMHYCYGLSVIHSNLLRGAGVVLTGLSVADPCFWDLFRRARGTSLAGVPYTFDLLDRVGFADMDLPHLRYVTQAGGRLAPERVAHHARLGRRRGWDLFVMYGQTEATARMAYLPPDLAAEHPGAIGVPVPGGAFRLEPADEAAGQGDGVGELVYTGPNVMLGYARTPADLALGRTVDALRTGDLARRTEDGLYEIVGRRSRFLKILGLRVDPQRIEALLARHGLDALCAGDDDRLVLAVVRADGWDERRIRGRVAAECGLPARAVHVHLLPELPRLANGKPDYPSVRALAQPSGAAPAGPAPASEPSPAGSAASPGPDPAGPGPVDGPEGADELCALYARVLDRPDVTPDSSFVSLGGDSLSYVEMSLQLEQRLGRLPLHWHTAPIRELAQPRTPGPRGGGGRRPRRRSVETSVVLRAVAIVCVVGSHIRLFELRGGAHLLLAVAGYNFARFLLSSPERRERTRRSARSIARIAVPTAAWTAFALLISDDYDLSNVLLLHNALWPQDMGPGIHLWFVEALVYILLAVTALLAIPAVHGLERRFPYGLPVALAGIGLLARYEVVGLPARAEITDAVTVFWLFALGWAAARSRTAAHRLLVTAAALAAVPGFFPGEPRRELFVMAGFCLLVWFPALPSSHRLNQAAGLLAGSSLAIYLTHWQVYPVFDDVSKHLALAASLVFGIAYAAAVARLVRYASAWRAVRLGPGRTLPRRWAAPRRRARRRTGAAAGCRRRPDSGGADAD
ncbi:Long-chain-fatty-acid--CoA ligase [Streptomyces rubrolavendulae]|uniref:Long-chain-fatty-acid--CoA ligase n=1 Tax=Streptomyces rubrolavendulae TaxID=285473 RepID=A0A1D8FWQ8_9ACTN|nr:Long-chain-fatty-acid--CoA ligase [Streptomyces rubrolavendulae]